jgi:4-oxalocrotonate tautomerase
MPIIRIDIWEGKSEEEKAELIKNVTESVAKTLNISKEWVHILINDVPKSNWGISGEPATKIK